MAEICAIIAKHQITEGGPVVLFQPENEHSHGHTIPFPNGRYFQYVMDQARKAGIVVPMISNDAGPSGNYAPGSGVGAVDIYVGSCFIRPCKALTGGRDTTATPLASTV